MKPWRIILQRARLSLIILGCAIALLLALIFGSASIYDGMYQNLMQSRAQNSAQQANLNNRRQDLAYVEAHIGQFRRLQKQGLLGTPDRENWVEQLLAARRQLGLPDTLTYALPPAAPLSGAATGAEPATEPATDGATNGDGTLIHELEINISGIQEEELLALLREFQARIADRFRVQSCQLSAPTESGLTAQCRLRFFTLPPTGDSPTPVSSAS